ncbi:MAG: hypothetical protein K0R19_159 [Bacillota bacterium]|nr:hypothetical protein [Bacillota bacterium]
MLKHSKIILGQSYRTNLKKTGQLNMRSWRNRQTRTVEGRVRESMGSSPFDRTNEKEIGLFLSLFRFCQGESVLEIFIP